MLVFKYLLQPESFARTLVSNHDLHCSVQKQTSGVEWIKIKSPGDDYSCHVVFNSTYKVTLENKKI
jgi:hypothetical protein